MRSTAAECVGRVFRAKNDGGRLKHICALSVVTAETVSLWY